MCLKNWDLIILTEFKNKPTFKWLLQNPICLLAFGFGTGLAPKAPGTFGTLPALLFAWLYMLTGLAPVYLSALCIPLFLVGIFFCDKTSDRLGVADYGGIVWDEIVAMLLILSVIPFVWCWWLLAFILFRFFDALKPWPISYFDRTVHGGFGIMLDDLLAVIPTLVCFYLLFFYINQ